MTKMIPTFLLLCISNLLPAKDLGTHGQTFPVEERNLAELIREKLSTLSSTEIDHFNHALQERFVQLFQNPPAVPGIGESEESRSYTFDPTITLSRDILDHQGNILVPKGTRVNPLDHVPLPADLLLFDGDNQSHIAWASQQSSTAMWVLVKGSPLALEQTTSRPVYFDQFGVLTKKLGIENVPARVTQSTHVLLIEEIPSGEAR